MPERVREELPGLANRFDTFVFDLDGVVYRGQRALPHAAEVLNLLQESGRRVFYLTNNSGATRQQYADKLRSMGVDAQPEQFITSGWATALYLQRALNPGAKLFVVGEPGLQQELCAAGFEVVDQVEPEIPAAVVVGIDRAFSYERLAQAQYAILNGARFIATNTDGTYPAEDRLLPGAGAIVAAIAAATSQKPRVIGKPNPQILQPFIERGIIQPERTLLIGDRLDTDIALANLLHIPCALVLTGVSARDDVACAPLEQLPQWVLNDLSELLGDAVDNLLVHSL
ncbi:MAG: HAD-IIA family hydrolase [Fimbriimonadales bacterium]|nr:HAD-IIA family hydrolase [Fimbriimonadales bacterium]